MPKKGFKSITIDEETYNTIRVLADNGDRRIPEQLRKIVHEWVRQA